MICVKCKKDVPDGPYCCQCGAKQEQAKYIRRRGNGQGTAFKRGKYWSAQITVGWAVDGDGTVRRLRRTKGGFATKREALAYIEDLRMSEQKTCPTLRKLYDTWAAADLPKLSSSKQIAYKKAWERLHSIEHRKIDSLTTTDLQNCVTENASSYYTARDMKVLLSHLYKRACADQFVPSNLAQWITLPELVEKEGEAFTKDEIAVMWESFADGVTFAGYLLLMIYSGMMPGELFACRKDMIDLEKCEIDGCGKKTKIRKSTVIAFADSCRPVVQLLMDSAEGDMLWPHNKDMFYAQYHETTKQIGVRDLPPYSCRHTTGTVAAKDNVSAAIIQRVMRHAKIATTQRYIHTGAEDAHRVLNQISAGS